MLCSFTRYIRVAWFFVIASGVNRLDLDLVSECFDPNVCIGSSCALRIGDLHSDHLATEFFGYGCRYQVLDGVWYFIVWICKNFQDTIRFAGTHVGYAGERFNWN